MRPDKNSETSTDLDIPKLPTSHIPPGFGNGINSSELRARMRIAAHTSPDYEVSDATRDEMKHIVEQLKADGVNTEEVEQQATHDLIVANNPKVYRYHQLAASRSGRKLVKVAVKENPTWHETVLDIAFQLRQITRSAIESEDLNELKELVQSTQLQVTLIISGQPPTIEAIQAIIGHIRKLNEKAQIVIRTNNRNLNVSTLQPQPPIASATEQVNTVARTQSANV